MDSIWRWIPYRIVKRGLRGDPAGCVRAPQRGGPRCAGRPSPPWQRDSSPRPVPMTHLLAVDPDDLPNVWMPDVRL